FFVSRKDELIKTKGERVSPKEIEEVLCEMDEVAMATVIGIPDNLFGQAIKVFIVPKKDTVLTQDKIKKYCRQHLEPFMLPKYVESWTALPKLTSGKIDKKKLSRNGEDRRDLNDRRQDYQDAAIIDLWSAARDRRTLSDRRSGRERRKDMAV
ncbi:MAG: hypothetical protein D3926_22410, partial [Desulfobacteraceae bacterium]